MKNWTIQKVKFSSIFSDWLNQSHVSWKPETVTFLEVIVLLWRVGKKTRTKTEHFDFSGPRWNQKSQTVETGMYLFDFIP